MLEGLEVVELKLSELQNENWTFRFDSEYLKKQYLKNLECLKNYSNGYLKLSNEIVHMSGGATPLGANYQESGVPFLRVQNIMQNYFSLTDIVFLSKEQDEEIKRSRLKERDVLLTITGVSYGKSTVVSQKLKGANINQHSVKITISENINPYFLSTFLNSRFGKLQSDKNVTGVTRPALDYQVIRDFTIPKLSISFQNKIEVVVKKSEALTANSEVVYTQAEQLLLKELGLKDWQPSTENINSKSFKESFLAIGRLDAEYYQPKYDEIEQVFSKFERIRLNQLVVYPISSGITPKAGGDDYTTEEIGIPFIRAVDLVNGEVSTDNFNYIKESVHNGVLKRTQLKNSDVLFSIAGTVGRCAIFNHNFDANINQAVCILRFKEQKVKRLYLVVFFNSFIGKEYVSKYARQGLQTNLNLEEVGTLNIPIIDFVKQQEISSLIQESFVLKHQSEHLLEVAKRAVEIAIEENEEKAIEYINQNTKQ